MSMHTMVYHSISTYSLILYVYASFLVLMHAWIEFHSSPAPCKDVIGALESDWIVHCSLRILSHFPKHIMHAIEPLGRQSMKSQEHWCYSNRTLSTSSRCVFLNHCNPSVNQIFKATQDLCKTSSGLQSWTVLGALPLAQPCLNFDIRGQLPVLV